MIAQQNTLAQQVRELQVETARSSALVAGGQSSASLVIRALEEKLGKVADVTRDLEKRRVRHDHRMDAFGKCADGPRTGVRELQRGQKSQTARLEKTASGVRIREPNLEDGSSGVGRRRQMEQKQGGAGHRRGTEIEDLQLIPRSYRLGRGQQAD